jgi:hypothetical protein
MLPVQPPARIEHMESYGGCGCIMKEEKGVIHENFQHLQEKGVRMGLLWEVVIDMIDKHQGTEVFVHWHMFPLVPKNLDYNEGDEGEKLEVVEPIENTEPDYDEYDEEDDFDKLEVVEPTGNTVTVHVKYDSECYASDTPSPSGLSVGSFDKATIDWNSKSPWAR